MSDPILIMATPRSGSSMTAGIFARHGVFTGKVKPGRDRNPKGFFESTSIRDIIRDHSGKIVQKAVLAERLAGFKARVDAAMIEEGYQGGPWLWKGSAVYWPAWFEYEKPIWVVTRRDTAATIRSLQRRPYALGTTNREKLRAIVDFHHEQMDILVKEHGAFEVDTQAVALGDFTSIERAIRGAGLNYSREIVDDFVERDQWHETA